MIVFELVRYKINVAFTQIISLNGKGPDIKKMYSGIQIINIYNNQSTFWESQQLCLSDFFTQIALYNGLRKSLKAGLSISHVRRPGLVVFRSGLVPFALNKSDGLA